MNCGLQVLSERRMVAFVCGLFCFLFFSAGAGEAAADTMLMMGIQRSLYDSRTDSLGICRPARFMAQQLMPGSLVIYCLLCLKPPCGWSSVAQYSDQLCGWENLSICVFSLLPICLFAFLSLCVLPSPAGEFLIHALHPLPRRPCVPCHLFAVNS